MIITGIGQDSHRFLEEGGVCMLGGVVFKGVPGMDADSDGDVVLHAICNAITSISHVPILGDIAIQLCHEEGIRDSAVYLDKALETLEGTVEHVAISIEGSRPRLQGRSGSIRAHVAELMDLDSDQVGLTVTSGDGLTTFGRGEGLMCYCILSVNI